MSDVLELVLPRRLESPNKLRWSHWRARGRETKTWGLLLQVAAMKSGELQAWSVIEGTATYKDNRGLYRIKELRKRERRRVTVVTYMKSGRNFIRDDDNLRFAVKPVNDALKRLGLIRDDARAWLEQPMPQQLKSPDGIERTVITIERVA